MKEIMTREDIEQLNVVEPYCFESDREEQWYNIGLKNGLEIADEHSKSPWISVADDLPCNHKELLLSTGYHTVSVFTYKKGGACGIDSMIIRNGKWEWEAWKENYLYWMLIPNLPKERS